MDKVVHGLQGIRKIVDDVLVYAPSLPVPMFHTWCHTEALKSQIAVTEADFGGFHLSEMDIYCSSDLLKSIRQFPRPKNLIDLRSWFAL